MRKLFLIFTSISWLLIGTLATIAIKTSRDNRQITAAALGAADELTGLLGTGYVIDDLLDAIDRYGTGDPFAAAVLRCQHVGWEKGPDAARAPCQRLLAIADTSDKTCRAHIEMALLETKNGFPAKALEHLDRPEPNGNPRLLSKFLLAKTEALNSAGDYAAALATAKQIKPTEEATAANALYQMGLSALGQGNIGEAEAHLLRAKSIRQKLYDESGGYDEYGLNLARVLRALGTLPGHGRDLFGHWVCGLSA